MLTHGTTAMRCVTVAVVAALAVAFSACGDPQQPADATATPPERFDERLEDAAATATASAGAARFNGEILGLYIAPSIDDWPQALRDDRERTIAGGCLNDPTGQGELDFMQPLGLPPGFEPAGYLASTGKPEVVACGGRATGLNFEYGKTNDDGTPATIFLSRGVARAETFDAAVADVTARTVGVRQAVVIAAGVADAPAQRSMVLFPEDFGATIVHAFNLPEADLLAFAASVAEASAPYWEELPSDIGNDVIRVCAEIPAGATSHQAAFGRTDDERTSRVIFSYFDGASNRGYTLVLHPGDALDDCPEYVRRWLAFGRDSALYDAARTWVATQRGELAGECATRPHIVGRDPLLADWCFYRPQREHDGNVVISVGRAPDYAIDLVMRPLDIGYELLDAVAAVEERPRFWYFDDEHAFRWTAYKGAVAYRLKAKLVAIREHAPDPCAEPPLVEEMREFTLDQTLSADAYSYFIDLPELPSEDAWYVAINGINADAMVTLEALGTDGEVLDQTGTTWIRDLFCVRPRREGG